MAYSNGEVLSAGSLNNTWRSIGSISLNADLAAGVVDPGGVSGFPLGEFNQFRVTGRLFFSGALGATFSPRLECNGNNGNVVERIQDGTAAQIVQSQTSTFLIRPLVSSGGQAWFQAHVSKGLGTGSHHFHSVGNELNWLGYESWGTYANSADIGSFLVTHAAAATLVWKSGTQILFEGKSQ